MLQCKVIATYNFFYMKTIVFCDIPMLNKIDSHCYAHTGNAGSNYEKDVHFAINAVLGERLKAGDEVKAVLLQTKDIEGKYLVNTQLFKDELDEINKDCGAKISYEMLCTDFEGSKENFEKMYRAILDFFEDDCAVYADITYGPMPLPMVLMAAMNFAEKFFNADIKGVFYGKVNFKDGKPVNPELFDVTPLYYMSLFASSINASSSKNALLMLDAFFGK